MSGKVSTSGSFGQLLRFPGRVLFVVALATASVGSTFSVSTLPAIAATEKPAAKAKKAPSLDQLIASGKRGNRKAVWDAAKMIVAMGGRDFNGAKTIRPLLRAEALRGSSASATAYAMMLQYGMGGPANPKEAPKWYARGAKTGNVASTKGGVLAYAMGWGVKRDTRKALTMLAALPPETRAKEMLKISQALLRPGSEEPAVAMEWLRRVVALQTSATVPAVELYARLAGNDPATVPLIRQWLTALADKGNPDAALALGKRLVATLDPKDRYDASELFFKVAETGDSRGMEALATLLAGQPNAIADNAAILKFLEEKALAGSNVARVSLGDVYSFQTGADESLRQKARHYFALAAQDGDADAQYKLAMMMLSTADSGTDTQLAKAYLSLAAAKGNKLAVIAAAQFGGMSEQEAEKIVRIAIP